MLLPLLGSAPAQGAGNRAWLALGDSYSSGEGIPGTTQERDSQGNECARAVGESQPGVPDAARAWPKIAFDRVKDASGFGSIDFVACTGAITDDWREQVNEATARSDRTSWNLVSLTFGGNNVLFSEVMKGCTDVLKNWTFRSEHPGCDVDRETLHQRIDMLSGDREIDSNQFAGELTLPNLYSSIADLVKPGGDVVVAGYPQLVEEPAKWSRPSRIVGDLFTRGACGLTWLSHEDADLLRDAAGYLNEKIRSAVEEADHQFESRGIHYHYADFQHVFEASETDLSQRHGVCSTQPWLNAITTGLLNGSSRDFRPARSFHPTQIGHDALGEYVGTLISEQVKFDDGGDESAGADPSATSPPAPPSWPTVGKKIRVMGKWIDYPYSVQGIGYTERTMPLYAGTVHPAPAHQRYVFVVLEVRSLLIDREIEALNQNTFTLKYPDDCHAGPFSPKKVDCEADTHYETDYFANPPGTPVQPPAYSSSSDVLLLPGQAYVIIVAAAVPSKVAASRVRLVVDSFPGPGPQSLSLKKLPKL